MLKICMLTTSNLANDSRILSEAEIVGKTCDLTILARRRESKEAQFKKKPYKVKLVGTPDKKVGLVSALKPLVLLFSAAMGESPDIFHAHDFDGLLIGFLPSLIKRKKLIYDSHELWSEVSLFGLVRVIRPMIRFLEKILVSKVSGIITVNLSLAKILKQKYHKPVLAVYNFPSRKKTTGRTLKQNYPGKKIIVYVGAFKKGRGLEKIVEAAQFLPKSFLFLFIGYGKEREHLIQVAEKRNVLGKIKFTGPFPPDELVGKIIDADLGLSLTENVSKSYYYSSPNKLFQYIVAHVPVLASNLPEHKIFITKYRVGAITKAKTPQDLARDIQQQLLKKNSERNKKNLEKFSKEEFSWEKEFKKIIDFYKVL